MDNPKFQFGNVVIVDEGFVGLVVKTWSGSQSRPHHYDVYVRSNNSISEYDEQDIQHYVYSKELLPEQVDFYDLP